MVGLCHPLFPTWWLGGVVVRTLDLRLLRRWFQSQSWHCLVISRWLSLAGELTWDVTTTQVNSALHPSGVVKSTTSFGWGKSGKVTSAGWHVTLCDSIWHVISRSGVTISIKNCYIRVYFTLHCNMWHVTRLNELVGGPGRSKLRNAKGAQNDVKKKICELFREMRAVFANFIITKIAIWLLNRLGLCLKT